MNTADLIELMQHRQSSRVPFDVNRRIPQSVLAQILEGARWAPTAHNMQNYELVVVDDRAVLDGLSHLATGGVDPIFVRENFAQLSFSEDELKKRKMGVLAAMFPESWRTPDFTPDQTEQLRPVVLGDAVGKSAALVLVLYDPEHRAPASEGDFLGIISLGCVMENMWLTAASLGIAVQIQTALTSEPAVAELKRSLGIPARLRIAYALRLGYPATPVEYLRVRRDVTDFAHHNCFGNRSFE